jgi:cell division GTPase FtsZ
LIDGSHFHLREEGERLHKKSIATLRSNVGSLTVIPNGKLLTDVSPNTPVTEDIIIVLFLRIFSFVFCPNIPVIENIIYETCF